MKNIIIGKSSTLWLLAATLFTCLATAAYAQNTTTTPNSYSAPSSADQRFVKPTVLAGCLRRGSGVDEYMLYGAKMQSWELKSDSVNLGLLVNSEVRVTVVQAPENDGTLTATSVEGVMGSCLR